MRCPDCRKKVHKDDVYCVWCSAPLQRGILPIGREPEDQEEFGADIPHKTAPLWLRIALPAALLILLMVSFTVMSGNREELPEPTAIAVPENAQALDTVIAQWEGFTLRADYLTVDETNGALEIIFTARNRSDYTILCGDPLVSVEGYQLRSNMYLELPKKKTEMGYLRIETEPLQSVGLHQIRELVLSMPLTNARDLSVLTRTEPVSLPLDQKLPERNVRPAQYSLLETPEQTVFLTGIAADPESGEVRLYTQAENRSEEETFLQIQNASWDGSPLGLSNYYLLPPGTRLLSCSRVYDVPTGEPGQLSFELKTAGGYLQTCSVLLDADRLIRDVLWDIA